MRIYRCLFTAALLLAALPVVVKAQTVWVGGVVLNGSDGFNNIITDAGNWTGDSLNLSNTSTQLVFPDPANSNSYTPTPFLGNTPVQIGTLTITNSSHTGASIYAGHGDGNSASGGLINGLNVSNIVYSPATDTGTPPNNYPNASITGPINLIGLNGNHATIGGSAGSTGGGDWLTIGIAPGVGTGATGDGAIANNRITSNGPVDMNGAFELRLNGDASGLGQINLTNGGALAVTPSGSGFISNVTGNPSGPLTQFTIFPSSGTTYTYSGVYSGNGQFVKNGFGTDGLTLGAPTNGTPNSTVSLTGQNTYTGATIIMVGTLKIGTDSALPQSTILSIHPGATLDVAGNQTVDRFSGSNNVGSIVLETGKTLTVDTNQYVPDINGNPTTTPISSSYAGAISDVPVSGVGGSLVISGIKGSKTTLSGSNTYTGGTTVSGGELGIKNTSGSALGTGPVTVTGIFNVDNTLINPGIISGAGGFTGALALNAGAVIFPKGTLNVGATTLYGGAVYSWALLNAGGGPGIGYGSLNINGGLDLSHLSSSNPFTIHPMSVTVDGSGNMNLGIATFDPTLGYSFTLASTTGITGFSASDFVFNWTSDFQNAYTGTWSVVQNGNLLQLQYVGAPIPEPAAGAALAGALALAGAFWRRKKVSRV